MYTCRGAKFPVNRCKTDHKRIKRNQTSDVGWSEAVPGSWMRESEGELFFHDIYYFTRNREQVDLKRSGRLHNTSYQRSEMVWWSTGLLFHFLRAALWLHMHGIAKSITDKYCEKEGGGGVCGFRSMLCDRETHVDWNSRGSEKKWRNDIMTVFH